MNLVILILLSLAAYHGGKTIEKLTSLPAIVIYLIIGLVLGKDGLDILSKYDWLTVYAQVAVILSAVVGGLSINISKVSKSPLQLIYNFIPSVVDVIIIALSIIGVLVAIGKFSSELGIYILGFSTLYAMMSPVISNELEKQRHHHLQLSSYAINCVLITLGLGIISLSSGYQPIAVAVLVLQCLVAFAISFGLGTVLSYLTKVTEHRYVLTSYLLIVTGLIVFVFGSFGLVSGIIIGYGSGLGFKRATPITDVKRVIKTTDSIFHQLGLPIIFIYTAELMQFDASQLFKLVAALIIGLGIIVKLITARAVNRKLSNESVTIVKDDYVAYIPHAMYILVFSNLLKNMITSQSLININHLVIVWCSIAVIMSTAVAVVLAKLEVN